MDRKKVVFWVEGYLYNPSFFQNLLSLFLLPLSWLYCFVMWVRFKSKTPQDMGVCVVGVGNLNVGGSGKTPLVTSLAKNYKNVAIVLRGYGRQSRGLVVVKDGKNILCDVSQSGDEAMIYAKKLKDVVVIVSEDRKKGIQKAKEFGVNLVFLDDAYSKHDIKKLDVLIDVQTKNKRCLPSGAYRERLWSGKKVLHVEDGKDFKRVVTLRDETPSMSVVSSIARPQRLDRYLPDVLAKHYFEDHHNFTKDEIDEIFKKDGCSSLLVTFKDYVKLENFDYKLSLLDLDVEVSDEVFENISRYMLKYANKEEKCKQK